MAKPHYRPQPITLELIRKTSRRSPPEKPREIRDSSRGLILRHQPSGYLALYVELGRGKRERLCDARSVIDPSTTVTLAKVRKEAQRLRGEAASGRDFQHERNRNRAVPTLDAYLRDTYGPWVTANRRSGAETLRKLEHLAEASGLGTAKLTDITPARVERYKAKRHKQVTAETLNRELAALHAALSRAVKLALLSDNPLTGLERAETDRHKRIVRALTAEEKQRLVAALESRDAAKRERRASGNRWREQRGHEPRPAIGTFADVLTPAVVTSLETGLRRGELFALEWPRVDFKHKTLHVEGSTAKSFETREVPLNDAGLKALRDWWLQSGQPKTGLVFTLNGEPLDHLKKSYHAVLKAAGIERVNAKGERVNWHSLRHTFGSLLGAAGVDGPTLKELMGHADLSTTQRYLHSDADRKRAAVSAVAAT